MKWDVKSVALFASLVLPITTLQAADVVGGTPQGENPSPWLASIQFIKFDLTSRIPVTLKTGDSLRAPTQENPNATLIVPRLGSMAWCDPVANPLEPNNSDIGECFGSTAQTQFVVLDLNKARKKGAKKAYVRLTLKTLDDGDHGQNDADDDLVPAMTVYQGRQQAGDVLSWYPNKFQNDAGLVGWKLAPFTGKATNNSPGWTTAYMAQGSLNKAVLTGKMALKSGDGNYLTVAIGGDARHADLAAKHPVNFQLDVEVDSKPLTEANSGNNGGGIDKCGCKIGVNQWHPSMQHCMAISLCLPLVGTDDQCKTPEMCLIDGGR